MVIIGGEIAMSAMVRMEVLSHEQCKSAPYDYSINGTMYHIVNLVIFVAIEILGYLIAVIRSKMPD